MKMEEKDDKKNWTVGKQLMLDLSYLVIVIQSIDRH